MSLVGSQEYLEQLYQQYRQNPDQLTPQWKAFFQGVEFATGRAQLFQGDFSREWRVYAWLQKLMDEGYLWANINPLEPAGPEKFLAENPLESVGLTSQDWQQNFQVISIWLKEDLNLKQAFEKLSSVFLNTSSLQVAHLPAQLRNTLIEDWFQDPEVSVSQAQALIGSLQRVAAFEAFLHKKFVAAKRFSIEGAQALIPLLEFLMELAIQNQVKETVIGMAHRGRLSVLSEIFKKPDEIFLAGFLNRPLDGLWKPEFESDVKYHMGYQCVRHPVVANGHDHTLTLTMAYNPSHLESVNPVVLGMCRFLVDRFGDVNQVLPILIHGEASFAGQGVVQESLQMSGLPAYNVGGAIHIVVDNQVGFTALASATRSTPWASDLGKGFNIPIIHVNGQDIWAVLKGAYWAFQWRQRYHKDVIINLVCYRKYGHNESDEPTYTQPVMYRRIREIAPVEQVWAQDLIQKGWVTPQQVQSFYQQRWQQLEQNLDRLQSLEVLPSHPLTPQDWQTWKDFDWVEETFFEAQPTGVDLASWTQWGHGLTQWPEGFHLHPKLEKLMQARKSMVMGQEPVDWAMGELMAFVSLMAEGYNVRLVGQDSLRGTFSHRHAGFYDQQDQRLFIPLQSEWAKQLPGRFEVYDSLLSEFAALGFEYGRSLMDPHTLVIWEAQFGDFVNGAQIIVDQYLSGGEFKWARPSGLVLLLPHGFEGQGPEHSHARLERFLQLSAQNNWRVCVPSSSAQIFHLLRWQMHQKVRRPLIVLTPKSGLRTWRSHMAEFAVGTRFRFVLDDPRDLNPLQVHRVVLAYGKLARELLEMAKVQGLNQVAIVCLEQLYPFPQDALNAVLSRYENSRELVLAQEEPENLGAFGFLKEHLTLIKALNSLNVMFVARSPRAVPATGFSWHHDREQKALWERALGTVL